MGWHTRRPRRFRSGTRVTTTRSGPVRTLRVADPARHAAVMRAGAGRVLGVAVAAIDAPRRCAGWRARRAVYTVSADVLVVAATARGRRGLSNRSPGGDERRDNHCRTECCLLTPPHAPILAPCR